MIFKWFFGLLSQWSRIKGRPCDGNYIPKHVELARSQLGTKAKLKNIQTKMCLCPRLGDIVILNSKHRGYYITENDTEVLILVRNKVIEYLWVPKRNVKDYRRIV